MEGIDDIRIVGIDERRPPKIRNEPYIDIYFKLSHQAPPDWCQDFNALLSKHPTTPKIKEKEGLYIDAWVREPEQIPVILEHLKSKVSECSRMYIERIERSIRVESDANNVLAQETGEQGRLNRIIADLDFEVVQADKMAICSTPI